MFDPGSLWGVVTILGPLLLFATMVYGGALVSVRVNDADKPRVQAVMDRSSVNANNLAPCIARTAGSV